MFNRKQLKKQARATLKQHYVMIMLLILLAAMLGTDFGGIVDILFAKADTEVAETTNSVISNIAKGNFEGALEAAAGNRTTISGRSVKIGGMEIGHQAGVFADIANLYASGSILAALASIIWNLTGSISASRIIFAIFVLAFMAVKTIFVTEVYRVVYSRMILEGRTYERVNIASLTYFIRIKRWKKVSLAFIRCRIYVILWNLTIVGGIIKHYSYAMVRYILAENPEMSGKDAIALSRRMMDGHKWEMFCLDLSFLGWDILSLFTGGLLYAFYVAPYKASVRAEYYVYIRCLSKESGIEGTERLNDVYLYEKADRELVDKAYADVIEILQEPVIEPAELSKGKYFLRNVLGVVIRCDEHEEEYRRIMDRKARADAYTRVIEGKSYPTRLAPVKSVASRKHLEHTYYMRHYSASSLVLIFFSFCLVGWLWEVSLHIVEDGVFVNRGVLHGPWLPIYGSGALLILTILNKFRKNPLTEFIAAIVLCGVVEYFGSWALEKAYDGQKWWDYTGYFLNLNGRICAEGLLVFGLAGVAAVYFVAPLLDNCFSRMKIGVKRTVCVVLLSIFCIDLVYSHYVPNTGEGITDYAAVSSELNKSVAISNKCDIIV